MVVSNNNRFQTIRNRHERPKVKKRDDVKSIRKETSLRTAVGHSGQHSKLLQISKRWQVLAIDLREHLPHQREVRQREEDR